MPPNAKKILEIHVKKRCSDDWHKIDFDRIVSETEVFGGADLEGIVREGVETAFVNKNTVLTTEDILNVVKNTHSFSES